MDSSRKVIGDQRSAPTMERARFNEISNVFEPDHWMIAPFAPGKSKKCTMLRESTVQLPADIWQTTTERRRMRLDVHCIDIRLAGCSLRISEIRFLRMELASIHCSAELITTCQSFPNNRIVHLDVSHRHSTKLHSHHYVHL